MYVLTSSVEYTEYNSQHQPEYGVPTTNPEVMGRLSHAVGNHTKHEGKENLEKKTKEKWVQQIKLKTWKKKKRERKGKRIHTEIFLNHLQFCQQDGLKKLPT